MTLYFEDRLGRRRVVSQPNSLKEANRAMCDFLSAHHYNSPYTRIYINPADLKELVFDIGSHSEFFYLSSEVEWTDDWIKEF